MLYNISETFYSIQGEGPSQGYPAFFIRFWGCAVECVWCDSKYTVNAHSKDPQNMKDENYLYDLVKKSNAKYVVLTGGEPFEQHCLALFNKICGLVRIEVETSGYIYPQYIEEFAPNAVRCIVSPKLNSAQAKKDCFAHVEKFKLRNSYFKFVVSSDTDADEVINKVKEFNIDPSMVYLMPEGVRKEDLLSKYEKVVEICKEHGFNFSPRLHVLIWGAKRGF